MCGLREWTSPAWLLALLALPLLIAAAAGQTVEPSPEPPPTTEAVETQRREAAGLVDLDEATRTKIDQLYKQALADLSAAQTAEANLQG
ncbi:MAG: hypothetical protein KDA41_21010, partial [Planctomycetales bacterium]|nr:hypothetical protein [Planctomycetales bacterium]